MEKADDISAEVGDFKQALENHVEGCDVLKVLKLFLFKLIMFSFNFFNITTLDFILQDFLGMFPLFAMNLNKMSF